MELNPMEYVDEANSAKELLAEERRESKLNNWVAIAVALLATFEAICSVTDQAIVKKMQHEQTVALDNWSFYQARTIRSLVAQSTGDQFTIESTFAPSAAAKLYKDKAAEYKKISLEQDKKKVDQQKTAEKAEKNYNDLHARGEVLELTEALIAVAVSLFALTSLTHKKWLFRLSLIPTTLGVIIGVSALIHHPIPLEIFTKIFH